MSNRGVYLVGKGKVELRGCDAPTHPNTDEVTLRVDYVGICGSDLHLIKTGEVGKYKVTKPIILGHEPSATVVAVGSQVKHLKKGDRVAVEHQIPDGVCRYCKQGRYNLCPNSDLTTLGSPGMDGALRNQFNWRADCCFKLPDDIDSKTGAMIQPMSVALHAVRRGNITIGHKVLVTGAGPIGLMACQIAKAYGASKVLVTDRNDDKLSLAKQLGADEILNVKNLDPDAALKQSRAILEDGADVAVECSGAEPSLSLAIQVTIAGGKVVLCGLGDREKKIPIVDASMREVDLYGVCRFANSYETAIALLETKKLPNMSKMITHVFPLDQAPKAFDTLLKGCDESGKRAIKVLIECNPH